MSLRVEQADQILQFVRFWKKYTGKPPAELVFDSQLSPANSALRPRQLWPGPEENSRPGFCPGAAWVARDRPVYPASQLMKTLHQHQVATLVVNLRIDEVLPVSRQAQAQISV